MANQKLAQHLANPNIKAFLKMIQWCESAGYRTLVYKGANNTYIKDLSRHPNIRVQGPYGESTAAGAYQFLYSTWKESLSTTGCTTFSETDQDVGAVYLLTRRNSLQLVLDGKVYSAINNCAWEWASFPSLESGEKMVKH